MSVAIRHATLDDVAGIAAVHVRAWQAGYRGIVPDDYLLALSQEGEAGTREQAWRESLQRQDAEVWVAHQNGDVLGWISVGSSRDEDAGETTGELWALYVDPAAWRRGIGRALWRKAESFLRSTPQRHITLWVLAKNTRAIDFYRTLGFGEDPGHTKSVERGGTPLLHIRLRLDLHHGVPAGLSTPRLHLRRWSPDDRPAFAALNADPQVMEHFPAPLTRAQSDAAADRIEAQFQGHGFGPWALEVPGVVPFAGFVGLSVPTFQAPFSPCVEIGWRLDRAHWGHGYATEAARAALAFGFQQLHLGEIVSFTVPANTRSWRVMEAIGMTRDQAGDFDHPNLPAGDPLRRHLLYRKAPP